MPVYKEMARKISHITVSHISLIAVSFNKLASALLCMVVSTAPGSDSRRLDLCLVSGHGQLRKRE